MRPHFLGDQMRHHRLASQESALQSNIDNQIPVFLAHLGQEPITRKSGVVDEDVEAAEHRDGFVYEALSIVTFGDVSDDAMGREAVGAQFRGGRLRQFLLNVADDHLGALFGQAPRGGGPQAPGRSGDDGNLVFQAEIHCLVPL